MDIPNYSLKRKKIGNGRPCRVCRRETDSRLMSLIEESAGFRFCPMWLTKVKSKDIQEKMDEIMSHVHTPLIDGLVKLRRHASYEEEVCRLH